MVFIQYVKWFSSLMWLQTTFSLQLLLLLRYPQMKRPLKFMAFRESLAVIVDSEKGNILDLRLESIKRALNLNFWSPLYFAEISDLCGQLDNGQVNPLAKKLDLDCLHPTGWLLWIFAPKMRFSNHFLSLILVEAFVTWTWKIPRWSNQYWKTHLMVFAQFMQTLLR